MLKKKNKVIIFIRLTFLMLGMSLCGTVYAEAIHSIKVKELEEDEKSVIFEDNLDSYQVNKDNGLVTVDITPPSVPTPFGGYGNAESALRISASDNYAYVAADNVLSINSQSMLLKVLPLAVGGK